MITIYTWQKIKSMKQEGFSIKKIAGTLKISKNTVKKYSRSLEPLIFHKQNVQKKLIRILRPFKKWWRKNTLQRAFIENFYR